MSNNTTRVTVINLDTQLLQHLIRVIELQAPSFAAISQQVTGASSQFEEVSQPFLDAYAAHPDLVHSFDYYDVADFLEHLEGTLNGTLFEEHRAVGTELIAQLHAECIAACRYHNSVSATMHVTLPTVLLHTLAELGGLIPLTGQMVAVLDSPAYASNAPSISVPVGAVYIACKQLLLAVPIMPYAPDQVKYARLYCDIASLYNKTNALPRLEETITVPMADATTA